jgi:tripartite-type tricarboxylate transporter receptor subunit TctC
MSMIPDVPTMGEAGYPGIEATGWNGIFVPAGTPSPVIDLLQRHIAGVLQSREMQDDAVHLGYDLGGEPPEQFASFVRGEVAKWAKVIKDAGIKAQ